MGIVQNEVSATLRREVTSDQPAVQKSGIFSLPSSRILQADVDGRLMMRLGAMVAYDGELRFERESDMRHGIMGFVKKALTGEVSVLAEAKGKGTLYLADSGKYVTLLELDGDSMCVLGCNLLAFSGDIEHDIHVMNNVAGFMAGGLFYVRLEGHGVVAVTSIEKPLLLHACEEHVVTTDPLCTVAWSGNDVPEIRTDITYKIMFGKSSGETFQMKFANEGFVLVQAGPNLSALRLG